MSQPIADRAATPTRRTPILALAAIATASAVVATVAGPLGVRAGLWGLGVGHGLFTGALPLALVAVMLALQGAFRTGRLFTAVVLMAVAIAAATPPLLGWSAAGRAAPIHDITTDLANPPRYVAIARLRTAGDNPIDYPGEAVARQQRASYAEVRPLFVPLPPKRALGVAAEAARAEGWTLVAEDLGFSDLGRLEATDRTFWFGRVDDIVVRVMPHTIGSRIDVRASARADAADDGRNARRIRQYLGLIVQRVSAELAESPAR